MKMIKIVVRVKNHPKSEYNQQSLEKKGEIIKKK